MENIIIKVRLKIFLNMLIKKYKYYKEDTFLLPELNNIDKDNNIISRLPNGEKMFSNIESVYVGINEGEKYIVVKGTRKMIPKLAIYIGDLLENNSLVRLKSYEAKDELFGINGMENNFDIESLDRAYKYLMTNIIKIEEQPKVKIKK